MVKKSVQSGEKNTVFFYKLLVLKAYECFSIFSKINLLGSPL